MEGVLNECCQKAMYFFGISQESERFYASLSAKAFGSKLAKGCIQINGVVINIMATISPILDSGFGWKLPSLFATEGYGVQYGTMNVKTGEFTAIENSGDLPQDLINKSMKENIRTVLKSWYNDGEGKLCPGKSICFREEDVGENCAHCYNILGTKAASGRLDLLAGFVKICEEFGFLVKIVDGKLRIECPAILEPRLLQKLNEYEESINVVRVWKEDVTR